MMKVRYKCVVFSILLSLPMVSNVYGEGETSSGSASYDIVNDSIKTGTDLKANYSVAYENALKRNEELLKWKQNLNDSIGAWRKELKKYENQRASIVKSNEKLEAKVEQLELKAQKSGIVELQRKRDALLAEIQREQEEKQLQDSCLKEVVGKLEDKERQMQNLANIKENVSNQIIAEYKGYLDKPFREMDLATLDQIKSKCQKYSSDTKVNAFVTMIENAVKNKHLFDDIVKAVNSPYKKFDIDRALAVIPKFSNINSTQQNEMVELKKQLVVFSDGLATFKEFINNLNGCRKDVNYSFEYYKADKTRIFRNGLEQRVKDKLLVVPYLKTKYERFMKEFVKNPNKHSDIETEILNQ